jgi:hypothetical protein
MPLKVGGSASRSALVGGRAPKSVMVTRVVKRHVCAPARSAPSCTSCVPVRLSLCENVLRTPHAAARSGCAGGRREGYPEEDHREMKMRLIKDALKATGRG